MKGVLGIKPGYKHRRRVACLCLFATLRSHTGRLSAQATFLNSQHPRMPDTIWVWGVGPKRIPGPASMQTLCTLCLPALHMLDAVALHILDAVALHIIDAIALDSGAGKQPMASAMIRDG